ncbi:NAD dependent epimerase/dehydratase family protein [Podospora aff. communis PSN243]|uniref:NAD dependent epimerase/dehydratase family protein n=1 Tax=Podospora aff. communis PSN243 TaxID=3040156 RepID=A0AAV9GYS9_9PEZI|nr:NAD dependent epimerase/dehydratase family protein [Podospora aff. communis PSN243]
MSQPTILVTGSSGHLGTALMLTLTSYGFHPIGIDILPSPTTHSITDITSASQLTTLFQSHPSLTHIIHTATLHKPHIASHPKSAFLSVNLTGTLNLLEAATTFNIQTFTFLSTTSTFGSTLSPKKGSPAAWIDESVVPQPKNIYGATKTAAEDLCWLFHKEHGLPVVVLRTSRFFPEGDDDDERREAMEDANLKVCELAYRRVDIEDVVRACVCALRKAKEVRFGKYIISAPPPVVEKTEEVLRGLDEDAARVVKGAVPAAEAVFAERGWRFLERMDRVYDSSKAVRELGWQPEYTFEKVVKRLAGGKDWRSELTARVGKRGYHASSTGVYTVR